MQYAQPLQQENHWLTLFVIGAVATFALATTVHASGISAGEVIQLVNAERSSAGLVTLKESTLLSQAAEAKARDMIKHDYFAHTSPEGKTPWYWMKQAGYRYKTAGENLAVNYSGAKEQHRAWMKSATHRANILNAKYREIGVAVVEGKIDGERSLVTVQMFGTPVVAVADQSQAQVPAVPVPTPAVQGLEETESADETLTPGEAPVIMPIPDARAPVIQLEPTAFSSPIYSVPRGLEMSFLVTALFMALLLVLGPLFFLAEASVILWSLWNARQGGAARPAG